MKYEPLFMEPKFKDYIWGGKRLKQVFNKNVENEECTAESWEISTNEAGVSVIKNGELKDKTLTQIFNDTEYKLNIFGAKCQDLEDFPLLVKFIDANSNLSVQVHPNDEYAMNYENSKGKTEMWYVLDCSEDAQIICGVKQGTTKEHLQNKIENNKVVDVLNFVNVKKGDVIYIPAGTIHALLGNTLVAEIQQNSNITYRVYDWDRVGTDGKPRQLHTKKAIDVIDVEKTPQITNAGNKEGIKNIIKSEYFEVDKINVKNKIQCVNDVESFIAFCVVEGSGNIKIDNQEYKITKGDSFILPACIHNYEIIGDVELLSSHM